MYKNDLALNNLQWLICHKTKPEQTKTRSKGNPVKIEPKMAFQSNLLTLKPRDVHLEGLGKYVKVFCVRISIII